MKKTKRKSLYSKYLEEDKENKEKKLFAEAGGVEVENIVINKVSTGGKIFEKLIDGFFIAGKVILVLTFLALASIGATVLLNAQLRNDVFYQILTSFQ